MIAGVGSGLTVSVAVCVITVVHAGVVELIARTLNTNVPALEFPTVNVIVFGGVGPVVCVATTVSLGPAVHLNQP